MAEAEKFNYTHLGNRKTNDAFADFQLMIQGMMRHAPQVAMNRDTCFIRENVRELFPCPSRNAFCEEMIRLIWRIRRQQEAD